MFEKREDLPGYPTAAGIGRISPAADGVAMTLRAEARAGTRFDGGILRRPA